MLTHKNDQELVTLYQSGEKKALEILITRHKRKVYSTIYLLVKDQTLAEDLFQDTFVKVINTLNNGNYNEEGKFLPWVARIAHNLVIDYFRKNQKMSMVRDTEEYSIFDFLPQDEENAEGKIELDQVKNQIRQLIELLPEDQKEVVLMRHFEDLSFKEIADSTGVSINTALGRMRYALINLKKLIDKKGLVLIS
jgi:RNA polymerase sigma-70 factor, ECF subfamily